MKNLEDTLDKIIETFFHLPTLVVFALIGLIIIWLTYDVSFDVGAGFARLTSNQGAINLYWESGCCVIDVQ